MISSLSFGSYKNNSLAPFTTRFLFIYHFFRCAIFINSLAHYTKGTLLLYFIASTVNKHLISRSFQNHDVFFIFPSRYYFTIGIKTLIRLEGGTPFYFNQYMNYRFNIFLLTFLFYRTRTLFRFSYKNVIIFLPMIISLTTTFIFSFDLFLIKLLRCFTSLYVI